MVEGLGGAGAHRRPRARRCRGRESELYRYLRVGHSPQHGMAAGPMAAGRAASWPRCPTPTCGRWRHYLASFNPSVADDEAHAAAQAAIAAGQAAGVPAGAAQRMFTAPAAPATTTATARACSA